MVGSKTLDCFKEELNQRNLSKVKRLLNLCFITVSFSLLPIHLPSLGYMFSHKVFRQLKKTEDPCEIFHLICNYLLSAVGNGGKEGFGGAIASKK